jgi:hypothetical protein
VTGFLKLQFAEPCSCAWAPLSYQGRSAITTDSLVETTVCSLTLDQSALAAKAKHAVTGYGESIAAALSV